jgi:hypothetical protein
VNCKLARTAEEVGGTLNQSQRKGTEQRIKLSVLICPTLLREELTKQLQLKDNTIISWEKQ